jgi:negative regulator of sigma E activity
MQDVFAVQTDIAERVANYVEQTMGPIKNIDLSVAKTQETYESHLLRSQPPWRREATQCNMRKCKWVYREPKEGRSRLTRIMPALG